ncbi:Zn-ribbon domain-containing OB-fold protein [Ottowia thiooxydans]|uniref:Zn-ribbon domain-containing OB-fold protein n=1 Tax=Ottowia thiooxydans TaxID=219182 RepID=UPI000685223C|nr:Zn-ribbon domain-containing OB-fold protein [Ottowia thiooxydans]
MQQETSTKPVPVPTPETEAFWEGCAQGLFLLQHCDHCGHVQFYPRPLCTQCHRTDLSWRAAGGGGRVHSYTVVYRGPGPAFDTDVPYSLVLVDLDEGPRIMANLRGASEDIEIGSRVRLYFEERGGVHLPQVEFESASSRILKTSEESTP